MVRIQCRTNLDLSNEQWPRELPEVPRMGDNISSGVIRKGGFRLELKVVRVTWESRIKLGTQCEIEWYPSIELHMTDYQCGLDYGDGNKGSITNFYKWYAPLVGRSVSAFI